MESKQRQPAGLPCRRYRFERRHPGGIWPSPPEGHNFVQLFVKVDGVAEYVERVEELGGRTIIPPQTLPDGALMAIVHDPLGIPFGLVSQTRKERR